MQESELGRNREALFLLFLRRHACVDDGLRRRRYRWILHVFCSLWGSIAILLAFKNLFRKSSSCIAIAVTIKGSLLGLPFEQDAKEAGHVCGDLPRVLFCEWSRTATAPDFQRSGDSLAGRRLATT